jgi:hypothetical protein
MYREPVRNMCQVIGEVAYRGVSIFNGIEAVDHVVNVSDPGASLIVGGGYLWLSSTRG